MVDQESVEADYKSWALCHRNNIRLKDRAKNIQKPCMGICILKSCHHLIRTQQKIGSFFSTNCLPELQMSKYVGRS